MGIPKEETVLKKNGIYKISRNPTYVGTLKNAMLDPAACAIRQPHDKPIETLPVTYNPLLIGGFPEKLPS